MKPIEFTDRRGAILAAIGSICIAVASVGFLHAQADQLTDTNAVDADTVDLPGDVNLKKSRVFVHVGKTGFGHDHAIVGMLKSGNIQLGASADAGKLEFDLTSFRADTDAGRRYIGLAGSSDAATRQQVDANMQGPAVLNVAKYPTAVFVVESAVSVQEPSRRRLPQYQLTGKFTLHGVTRQVQFMADSETTDGGIHLRGSFSILQSQFGIQPFTKAFGAIGVADRLSIWGDLWLAEKPAAAAESAAPSRQ